LPSKARATKKPFVTVYLSLGSNLGDKLAFLRGALRHLERHDSINLEAISSVYETDPVGLVDQPAFLNIVIRIRTSLSPHELLALCQETENHFDRDRSIHWGPRTLDIDLLTYEGITMNEPDLILPHPRMSEREFVQIPLQELNTGEVGCSESVRPIFTQWYHLMT
jgi:2-amino-4-hydroxy-6-hydroxymethyldihydropteridine diphosphokinase